MMKATMMLAATLALLTACSGGKSKSSTATAPPAGAAAQPPGAEATPNCNGQSPVWALGGTKAYLLPEDRLYGRTRRGEYLCPSQAHAQGYHHARGKRHRHHRGVFSV